MNRGERPTGRGGTERGFALVLAILALMLLTFLGLTLAATTSTELQIATNYRWSQQALYNAEAGLEAAKLVLSNAASPTAQWAGLLPTARTAPWPPSSPPGPADPSGGPRDYYQQGCQGDRGGIGYGRVLAAGGVRYENVSQFMGQALNGGFTIWIRRGLQVDNAGMFSDSANDAYVIVTSEGVAPYVPGSGAFAQANQAVRVLEMNYLLVTNRRGESCGGGHEGQTGLGPSGENFDTCSPISPAGLPTGGGPAPTGTGVD
jgi:hypothetical protein